VKNRTKISEKKKKLEKFLTSVFPEVRNCEVRKGRTKVGAAQPRNPKRLNNKMK